VKKDGLERLLEFLDILRGRGIDAHFYQEGPDGIIVYFSLYGVRVEVTFTVDGMQYSIFKGDESVESGLAELMSLIEERSK